MEGWGCSSVGITLPSTHRIPGFNPWKCTNQKWWHAPVIPSLKDGVRRIRSLRSSWTTSDDTV